MYQPKSLKITNIISFKEQAFHFRNGKAVLLIGENLDDSSQERNGAGKSALIESMALAFTGSSIRDVKTKELINNDADAGEVEMVLLNMTTGAELKIWRKIYSGSKSAEYRAWINDKEQSDRYSDLNMFNAFVWETIGISKEDFFNFYLITKENYTPFLLVGDTKKKEIINRFSGADKVDLVFPEIETDAGEAQKKIIEKEKELTGNLAKQEVLAEQLVEEEEKVSEEKHQEAIKEKELLLFGMQEGVSEWELAVSDAEKELQAKDQAVIAFEQTRDQVLMPHTAAIQSAQADLDEFEVTIADQLKPHADAVDADEAEVAAFTFSKNYEAELSGLADQKRAVNAQITGKKLALPAVKMQFADEIEAIQNEEKELREQISEAEAELRENEQFESDLNKSLQDSIECPKCQHKFSLRDKTFNYEEAVAALPEVQQAIAEYKEVIKELKESLNTGIQVKKQAVNDKVVKAGDGIKDEIEQLNHKLVELGNIELTLKQEMQVELQAKQKLVDKVAEAKRQLQWIKNQIEQDKNEFQQALNTAKRNLVHAENKFNDDLLVLKSEKERAHLQLNRTKQSLKDAQQEVELMQQQIEKLKTQEVDRTKALELQAKIEALVVDEEKINQQLETLRKEKEAVDAWEIHFKNFKSHLANKSIKNIQDYTNLFLDSMGSNLAIRIDGYKTLANKKIKEQITTSVLRDGFDAGSYGKFSGGERARIDICSIVGMQELITINAGHGKGLDMLFCDEILESVDVAGMECIINSLQTLGKTILIVSQNEINALAEHTVIIQKKNKVSKILNNQIVNQLKKAA